MKLKDHIFSLSRCLKIRKSSHEVNHDTLGRKWLLFLQMVIHPDMMQMWCISVEKKTYISSWVSLTQLSWHNSLIKSLQTYKLAIQMKKSFWWWESKSRGIHVHTCQYLGCLDYKRVTYKSSKTNWNHFFRYQYKWHAKR